jgi:hypothetical protein
LLAGIAVTGTVAVAWSERVHQDVAAPSPKPIRINRILTVPTGAPMPRRLNCR